MSEQIPSGDSHTAQSTHSPVSASEVADAKSKWSAMAEFDAAEADMAQVQTRPVDAVRAEEEELLENNKPVRPPRERFYQYPSANRLATGGIAKPKLTPEQLAERMERMKLKNEQLLARRMRSEADENQYKEQEEARQQAQEEQRMRIKQKKEDDSRIQSAIDRQREEVRQKKLGKALEWDQEKPALDEDDALPSGQRYYANYNRRGQGERYERGARRGRGRPYSRGRGSTAYADQQPPPPAEDEELWPALPSATPDDRKR